MIMMLLPCLSPAPPPPQGAAKGTSLSDVTSSGQKADLTNMALADDGEIVFAYDLDSFNLDKVGGAPGGQGQCLLLPAPYHVRHCCDCMPWLQLPLALALKLCPAQPNHASTYVPCAPPPLPLTNLPPPAAGGLLQGGR
jgi:hypothetical protein